jgi:hypothetical protein
VEAKVQIEDRLVTVKYELGSCTFGPTSITVNGEALATEAMPNPYRKGGLSVALSDLVNALNGDDNDVIVVAN